MNATAAIKRLANVFGVELNRYRPERSEAGQLKMLFDRYGVNVVFDVGANIGQYASAIRAAGFSGRIVSFEALSSAHGELALNRSASRDMNWLVAPMGAIGSEDGQISINIAGNSASSSVLPMLDQHLNAAPHSRYTGSEIVPLRRMDSLANQYLDDGSRIFLKIDTQGYESEVLDGASALMERVSGVQLELSLASLYGGQPRYEQLINRMSDAGFMMRALWPGFRDENTGELLQFDAAFFRSTRASLAAGLS